MYFFFLFLFLFSVSFSFLYLYLYLCLSIYLFLLSTVKINRNSPPWNLKFLLIRGGGLFLMIIFDGLFLKKDNGVPMVFFVSKFRSQNLKKNIRFWGGAVPGNKIGKIHILALNRGGCSEGGRGQSGWFLLYLSLVQEIYTSLPYPTLPTHHSP